MIADWKIADAAIAQMKMLPPERPFFLAVGFRLSHVPCFASQQWFDRFPPEDQIILPPVKEGDRDDVPDFAWYLHWKLPEPRLSWLKAHGQWRPQNCHSCATARKETPRSSRQTARFLPAPACQFRRRRHASHRLEGGKTLEGPIEELFRKSPALIALFLILFGLLLAFAIIANNYAVPAGLVDRASDGIIAALAAFRR